MSKTKILELLIKEFGLIPIGVGFYRTDSNGGEYGSGIGWKGKGVDITGKVCIEFSEPDGFEFAVNEIIKQGKK